MYKAVHPGEVLKAELKARGITQRAFAKQINMDFAQFNFYVIGRRGFSPRFALTLEDALGIPAESWMRMRADYDVATERTKRL